MPTPKDWLILKKAKHNPTPKSESYMSGGYNIRWSNVIRVNIFKINFASSAFSDVTSCTFG